MRWGGADQQICCPPPPQGERQFRPRRGLRSQRREPAESREAIHPTEPAPWWPLWLPPAGRSVVGRR
eukprot:8993321-Pyramimonas_sp.AAC.1